MVTGNRIILPEHINRAENEPDPLAILNDEQEGPFAGWIDKRIKNCGLHFDVSPVKREILVAYSAIKFAHGGGVLPRVQKSTIGEYFQELIEDPEADPFKTEVDPDKLTVVRSEFSDEQTYLADHTTTQLGDGMLHEHGLTYIAMIHRMLMRRLAEESGRPNGE